MQGNSPPAERPSLLEEMMRPVAGMFRHLPGEVDLVSMHHMDSGLRVDREDARSLPALEARYSVGNRLVNAYLTGTGRGSLRRCSSMQTTSSRSHVARSSVTDGSGEVACLPGSFGYIATMADFLLVAGAWLGSWAWDEVVPELHTAGHDTHPLTLSGLAEKRGVPAGQQTHVQDIVDEVERRDLREVILVGHSYSGIPVGQAAERIGDRLARVVFVDSNVPTDGESFISRWPAGRAMVQAAIADGKGFWAPLTSADFDGQDLTGEQIARIVRGSTPHPGATLTEPAVLARPLGELAATYIKCLLDGDEPSDDVAALLTSEHWHLVEMDTGHWPMFSRPRQLARILLDAA